MFENLKRIFEPSAKTRSGPDDEAVAAAVEQAIDGTDPRLRLVSGYRRRLRKGATRALSYVDELVSELEAPTDFDRAAFSSSAYIRAFFASVNEITALLESSRSFQRFLEYRDNRQLPQCYALLAMEKEEKTTFGTTLEGEMLRRDVRQTAVNFRNHRLITPSATEELTRRKLKERAYNDLLEVALVRITELRSVKDELEDQRGLLRSKLANLKKTEKFGLESELETQTPSQASVEQTQRQLADIEKRLRKLTTSPATLEDYLGEIQMVMESPERFLNLDRVAIKLTRMGIKLSEKSDEKGVELALQRVKVGHTLDRIVTLVAIPQEMMHAALNSRRTGFGLR